LCSEAFRLKYFLYRSNVKMVLMLFAFPAREATIAAVSAAKERPFNPTGNKFNNTDRPYPIELRPS